MRTRRGASLIEILLVIALFTFLCVLAYPAIVHGH
jgi:Tfp pilus assembly protein FimT